MPIWRRIFFHKFAWDQYCDLREFEEAMNKKQKERDAEEAREANKLPWKSQFARDILEKVVPELVHGHEIADAKCETFYPGRMLYLLSKDPTVYQPLPKVILRAKQECPDPFVSHNILLFMKNICFEELNPVTVPADLLKTLKSALKNKKSGRRKYKRKMKKEKGRSSKRRKLEDGSSKSKSSKYKSSDTKPKRKSSKHSKDKFNPIRAIESSRKKKDEPQEEDLTQYMDVE